MRTDFFSHPLWGAHDRHSQRGVTSTEYALIAALIAIVIVGSVNGVGEEVLGLYDSVSSQIADVVAAALN